MPVNVPNPLRCQRGTIENKQTKTNLSNMKNVFARAFTLALLSVTVLTACQKEDVLKPQPTPPVVTPPAPDGHITIKLKAAITVGDVVYDSIPATFRITSWDEAGVQHQKDTALDAGAKAVTLPKGHSRFAFSVNKWGVEDQLVLTKNEITEGSTYTLGGSKAAKKLQSVTQYSFLNGTFAPTQRQVFAYDAQGRIQHIDQYGADEGGVLRLNTRDEFIYTGNGLKIENVSRPGGVRTVWFHYAYAYDALGRAIQSEYRYITQHEIFTNHYNSNGINMLMGEGATDQNGARIALKFAGGNRVEEKTVLPGYPSTIVNFTYDFNVNPYAVIKMPSQRFELSSKNNTLTEVWENYNAYRNENSYDADGYPTEVITKVRTNSGAYVANSKTVYTY